ncbi:MAG: hypothetical protein FHP94_19345 [Denitromonas halophila]|nr:MAG: hypothetical protein FHP94_19345 [Denitromonas halophila]TVT70519.1 MAG: hypothetical protein FHP93_11800 [Denitromonas halophila]
MRFFSGWFGIAFFAMIFHSELPEDSRLTTLSSLALVFSGVALMYFGREYLPAWLGHLLGGDDNAD